MRLLIYAVSLVTIYSALVEGTETDQIAQFVSWIESVGGRLGPVRLSHNASYGTGVVATSKVASMDELVSMPLSHVVSASTARQRDRHVATLDAAVADDVVIATFLATQLLMGAEQSAFAPYLAVLPSHVPSLLALPDALLRKVLPDARLLKRISTERSRREKASGAALKVLRRVAKKNPLVTDGLYPSLESLFAWGMNIVASRAITLKGVKYLVPFAGMFNHANSGVRRDSSSGAAFTLTHQITSDNRFVVRSDRDTNVNQEIFEDYGDNSNVVYALFHGFVVEDNPFDCVDVDLSAFPQAASRISVDLLERLSVPRSLCLRSDSPLPASLDVFASLLAHPSRFDPSALCVRHLESIATQHQQGESASLLASAFFDPTHCPDAPARNATLTRATIATFLSTVSPTRSSQHTPPPILLVDEPQRSAYALAQEYSRHYRVLFAQLGASLLDQTTTTRKTKKTETKTTTKKESASRTKKKKEGAIRGSAVMRAERMIEWMTTNGCVLNKLTVREEPGMRLGTQLTSSVALEEPYLSVPKGIIMSSASAMLAPSIGPLLHEIDSAHGKGGDLEKLLLFLVHEKFVAHHASHYWPYLATLPTMRELRQQIPSLFPESSVTLLRETAVYAQLLRDRTAIRNRASTLESVAFRRYPKVFPSNRVNRDSVLWAHAIVDTRSIWFNGTRNLVPLLDMINCGGAEVGRAQRVHRTHAHVANAVTHAARAYSTGDFLHENYGQPNYVYFLYHGFVLDSRQNAHDCYPLAVDIPQADHRASLASLLKNTPSSHPYVSCMTPGQDVPVALLQVLRVVHAVSTDAAARDHLQRRLETQLRRLKQFNRDNLPRLSEPDQARAHPEYAAIAHYLVSEQRLIESVISGLIVIMFHSDL